MNRLVSLITAREGVLPPPSIKASPPRDIATGEMERIVTAPAEALVQQSAFVAAPSIKERMETLGKALTDLKERREMVSGMLMGDGLQQESLLAPDEAGLGEWLDFMISFVDAESENLNVIIAAL